MASSTGRFRKTLLRIASAVALSVVVAGVGLAPASAQVRTDNGNHYGWYKNGKAQEKEAKKAARLNRQAERNGVVVDNGTVVDRSRVAVGPRAHRNTNQYTYRNGSYYDQYGNRVYDYRGTHVDPYAAYPQYRRNTYRNYNYNYPNNGYYNTYPYGNGGGYSNTYPYGNGGYYGNSNPYYYDNREGDKDRDDVARAAAQNGYYEGFQRGQYDASQRNRPNPSGHGAYQFGYDGFDPSWGSSSTYQQTYRQYFVQGYNDGYGQRSYTSRFPRRRF